MINQAVNKQNDMFLTTHVNEESNQISSVWDHETPAETEQAIDLILNYLLRHNLKPTETIEGTITQITTSLIEQMDAIIPEELKAEQTLMLDHICDWMVDYASLCNIQKMRLKFGFGEEESVEH